MQTHLTRPPAHRRRCDCGVHHRKWTTFAKCQWPRAIWIYGDGPIATVAHCVAARAWEPYFGRSYIDSQTVMLHPTREDALLVLDWIGATGCGGVCAGTSGHELVDLEATT